MKALGLLALLVYTFGALAYGSMLILWAREMGRPGSAGHSSADGRSRQADGVHGALFVVSFLWFCCNVALVLVEFGRERWWPIDAGVLCLAFAFPPIVMHLSWAEATRDRAIPRGWRLVLWPAYTICMALPVGAVVILAGAGDRMVMRMALSAIGNGISVALLCAAVYSIALVARHGHRQDARQRQSRRSLLGLFILMAALFGFLLLFKATGRATQPMLSLAGDVLEVAARSLPLVFMFVGTYYKSRFRFFDLFVKRGLTMLIALGGLTVWFAIVLPSLTRAFGHQWAAPWIYAIALLPVVGALPWSYSRIAAVLDRRWLGRRFTTVEAVTRFLSGLHSATTEPRLIERAQAELAEIFGAPALVQIGATTAVPSDFTVVQQTHVRLGDRVIGRFLMGPRAGEAPYFGEDVALLASLAGVFASVVENLHLQERKLEQEQKTRELSLHASRSELKALRAQINPHFLFNALNSIAGLIHQAPAVADRTIEQLADVFRYALRGAESEWARLDDELDFVRAYLEVERARFGDRLQADVRMTDDVRGARLPTMMVQTLVENAVKHGVAAIRGRAIVEVSALQNDGRLVVSVADNGPGFEDTGAGTAGASGGYGLANIRQRLEGYFGPEGRLIVTRDRERTMTVVSVSLPLFHQEPRQLPGTKVEHEIAR